MNCMGIALINAIISHKIVSARCWSNVGFGGFHFTRRCCQLRGITRTCPPICLKNIIIDLTKIIYEDN